MGTIETIVFCSKYLKTKPSYHKFECWLKFIEDRMTIFEIRDKLIKDEIGYSDAFEEIKKFPKPWHSKDWVKKRDSIIKSECEQCKNTEGIMVAQHLTHPIDFKTIRNEIFNSLFTEFLKLTTLPNPIITNKEIKEFHDITTQIREACPGCKWIRIRKRKTMKPEYFW